MRVLGVSCFFHDSAASLIVDGHIIAAAQEERFTRKKHDPGFPKRAVEYCLRAGHTSLREVDAIVFYEKPFLKFERLLETYLAFAPRGFGSFIKAMPIWISEKIFQKTVLEEHLNLIEDVPNIKSKIYFSEHHLSHAASAYYPSPFDHALVLTMDGVGEWATSSLGVGRGRELKINKEIKFPHSLGLLYSAFTYYTGFKVNSGEYKLMGLAPYGEPIFAQKIKDELVDIKEDGSFHLNMDYFNYCAGLTMTTEKFHRLFDLPPRKAEELLVQKHMDLAASIQAVTEEIMLKLASSAQQQTGEKNLCLAGGVALNCVANGHILRSQVFENLWIQPAAGDAGGSLGAALAFYHLYKGGDGPTKKPGQDLMQGAYLGPEFTEQESIRELTEMGARFTVLANKEELITKVAHDLASGKAIGWMQGRMEFGPRALGARSIIADPRSPKMQSLLNLKVKFRESFRPFAPSVLRDNVSDWFEMDYDSPYMLLVAGVKKSRRKAMTEEQKKLFGIDKLNIPRSEIPAVTHVDYSARVQTVHRETNPLYYELIKKFGELTNCSVLVNTSFNVRGEPIVCTPGDAFRCLMGTDIEVLVVGNLYLSKAEQDPALAKSYKDQFELD